MEFVEKLLHLESGNFFKCQASLDYMVRHCQNKRIDENKKEYLHSTLCILIAREKQKYECHFLQR